MPEARLAALAERAPRNARVERARPDFRALLRGADLSISQAGYNTAVDLLAAGCRALLVPFEAGRETEQRLRAEILARRGLADVLPEDALTPESLAAAATALLARPPPAPAAPAAPAAPVAVARDGAARTVALVRALLAGASPALPSPAILAPRPDWGVLDAALARAQEAGRTARFWWRDDDAVARTPALDRLLALARRHAWPLAVAAVPGRAEPSLADRLAGEDAVEVAVHGLLHRDHAPAGEKRAEFGPHRPLAVLEEEARAALALARKRLGPRLVPVLVPPWNRIAPALAARLPALGYRGLSVHGPRPAGARGRINTHLDPVDWHGGRGLAEPAGLVAGAAGAVATGEPVGLLTHHGAHDEATWTFCERLLAHLAGRADLERPSLSALVRASPLGAPEQ